MEQELLEIFSQELTQITFEFDEWLEKKSRILNLEAEGELSREEKIQLILNHYKE